MATSIHTRPDRQDRRAAWHTTIGLKVSMALSAFVLVGYILIHVLGNLLIFLGPSWINGWGALLHATGPLLWIARLVIFVALVVHVVVALILSARARRARPVPYEQLTPQASTLASRTMLWTGIVLLVFAGYHVPQLTAGWWHPRFAFGDDYGNVVRLFRQTIQYPLYAAALVALALHMYHGTWSMLRTLGITLPARGPRRARSTTALTIFVTVGFVAIMLAVAGGWFRAVAPR
jgi:succinate dehydrogenase / fumarate reductase, cytochrome b subunit